MGGAIGGELPGVRLLGRPAVQLADHLERALRVTGVVALDDGARLLALLEAGEVISVAAEADAWGRRLHHAAVAHDRERKTLARDGLQTRLYESGVTELLDALGQASASAQG